MFGNGVVLLLCRRCVFSSFPKLAEVNVSDRDVLLTTGVISGFPCWISFYSTAYLTQDVFLLTR